MSPLSLLLFFVTTSRYPPLRFSRSVVASLTSLLLLDQTSRSPREFISTILHIHRLFIANCLWVLFFSPVGRCTAEKLSEA